MGSPPLAAVAPLAIALVCAACLAGGRARHDRDARARHAAAATASHAPAAGPQTNTPTASAVGGAGAFRDLRFTFGDDKVPPSFYAWGCKAGLSVESEDGQRYLAMAYHAVRTTTAGLEVCDLSLPPDTGRLSLDVRPAEPTSLAVELVGPRRLRYQVFFYLTAGRWQTLDVPIRSFWPSETSRLMGPLDPTAVTQLRLVDVANLPGEVGLALGLKDGPQELDVRSLAFGPGAKEPAGRQALGAPATAEGSGAGPVTVDSFNGRAIAVLPVGGAGLSERPDPAGGRELEVSYRFGGYRWAGFLAGIGQLPVARLGAVCLQARANPSLRLNVVLEERCGRKYSATARVASGGPKEVRLPLASFRPEGMGFVHRPLRPADLRVVMVVADTFSTNLRPGERGTYWVRDLALSLLPPGQEASPHRRPGEGGREPAGDDRGSLWPRHEGGCSALCRWRDVSPWWRRPMPGGRCGRG